MGAIIADVIPRTSKATLADDQRNKLDMEISSFQILGLTYWKILDTRLSEYKYRDDCLVCLDMETTNTTVNSGKFKCWAL